MVESTVSNTVKCRFESYVGYQLCAISPKVEATDLNPVKRWFNPNMAYQIMKYFIIVPPVSSWDEANKEKIWLDIGISTISTTAGGAWFRQTRGDMSKVQAWFDKGYRIKEVELTLY